MDSEIAHALLASLGLRLSARGEVTDGDERTWGHLGGETFVDYSNHAISLAGLESLSLGVNNELIFSFEDGRDIMAYPEAYMSSDRYIIRETPSDRRMPTTTATLNDVFEELFPTCGEDLFYDELKERDMMDMRMLGRSGGVVPMSDSLLALYHDKVERRLYECGFTGRLPVKSVMDEVLHIRIYGRKRNMFREWVESHAWDRKPRVRTWFKEMFGATAPPLLPLGEGYEDTYLGDVSEAWFVGAVRRQYMETRHEIVPVLIGGQGIGKGLGLRYTAGSDEWYIDTSSDIKDPKFMDGIRGRVVVEMSEATQFRNSDAEAMKGFISKSCDKTRKPYAAYDEDFPRHFVLVATTNLQTIFTDITGNRRYFPMYCDPSLATRPIDVSRTRYQYEVEQVWAEALYLYKAGAPWYMTPRAQDLASKVQDYATAENEGVSAIDRWLDDPMNGLCNIGAHITKQSIVSDFFGMDPKKPLPSEQKAQIRAWENGTVMWRKSDKPIWDSVSRRSVRAYVRIAAPGYVPVSPRLKIIGADIDNSVALAAFMRDTCRGQGVYDVGATLSTDGISADVIADMVDEGYIEAVDDGRGISYVVRMIP